MLSQILACRLFLRPPYSRANWVAGAHVWVGSAGQGRGGGPGRVASTMLQAGTSQTTAGGRPSKGHEAQAMGRGPSTSNKQAPAGPYPLRRCSSKPARPSFVHLSCCKRPPAPPPELICELITSIEACRLSNDFHVSLVTGGGVWWGANASEAGGVVPRPSSGKRTWVLRRGKRRRWKQVWKRTLKGKQTGNVTVADDVG